MTKLTLELIDQTFETPEAIVKLTENYNDGNMCNLDIFDSYLNLCNSYYISKANRRKRRRSNRKFKKKDRGNFPFYSHEYRVYSKKSKTKAEPSKKDIISEGLGQYMYDSLFLTEY